MNFESTIDTTRHDRNTCFEFSAVMPSIPADINTLLRKKIFYFRFLPIKNIYVIGPETINENIKRENDTRIIFVNENELADVSGIREIYSGRTKINPGRAGWYIQQFIKMNFARYTSDDYYLIWDSDTFPVKRTEFFSEDMRPYFDMKTEHHKPYFETISRILPGIAKAVNRSFISEHMLVRTEYMREMLNEIESQDTVSGTGFQEKILSAIDDKNLPRSGFSEYETFGSYVMNRHNDSYILRDWRSFRHGGRIYAGVSQIDKQTREWLAESYDAITLERYHRPKLYAFICRSEKFRKFFAASVFEKLL